MPDTKQISVQELPDWLREPYEGLIGRAETLSGEGYAPYGGPRIAQFSGLQDLAFQGAPGVASAGQTQLGLSQLAALQGGQGVPQQDMSQYMNPYMMAAIQPALQDIERQYLKETNRLGGQAASAGAYGGSRQALLESELTRNMLEARGDLTSRGLAAAYESGLQSFGQDQQRRLESANIFGQLGEANQLLGLRGGQYLQQTGGTQQLQEQAGLDVAYQDFLEQRDWPYGQLSFLQSILSGGPQVGTATTTTKGGGGNQTAQILGGISTGLGLADTAFDLGSKIFG